MDNLRPRRLLRWCGHQRAISQGDRRRQPQYAKQEHLRLPRDWPPLLNSELGQATETFMVKVNFYGRQAVPPQDEFDLGKL
jgi:hypothetical protein